MLLWYRDHKRLSDDLVGKQAGNKGPNWSIDQVRGKPNTTPFGDIVTAWASGSQNGQPEWIIAEYPSTTDVNEIHVYETYNPGALVKITSVSMTGDETLIWTGKDPAPLNTINPGRAEIKLPNAIHTRRIKLYLDSPAVDGWNEIDAIAIINAKGWTQWASDAWASSSYGHNRTPPSWFWP